MDYNTQTGILITGILWIVILVLMLQVTLFSRHKTSGLPIALCLVTSLIHLGALVYLNSDYDQNQSDYLRSWQYTRETVASGFEISCTGFFGYLLGIIIFNKIYLPNKALKESLDDRWDILFFASKLLLIIGVLASVILKFGGSLLDALPGMTALTDGFNKGQILGSVGLMLYFSKHEKSWKLLFIMAAIIVGMLGFQMLAGAVLADSVAGVMALVSFRLILFRPSVMSLVKATLGLFVTSYILLLGAVLWLEIRGDVRAVVWSDSSLSERIDSVVNAVSNAGVFNGTDQKHLEFIDARLNQNVIVGKAIEMLELYPGMSERGSTLFLGLIGWVPRTFWSDKPERGGSKTVSKFTGLELSDRTTFGTGPIFDFYINFKAYGVFFGCILYGAVLRWLDIKSANLIFQRNLINAAPYFFAGFSMLTATDSMFFVVNGAISAALAGYLTKIEVRRRWPLLFSQQ